jgi:hypothetical protein
MSWTYNGTEFNDPIEDYFGFVYCITDLENNKKYIGRKYFWATKTKTIKGKKKKVKVESDWRKYFSSSDIIKNLVKEFGEERFKREILYLTKSRGQTNYMETKMLFLYDVLEAVDENNERIFYNNNILLRYYSNNIK